MNKKNKKMEISDLIGKVLVKIEGCIGDERLEFHTSTGDVYILYHEQECCESVSIDDIVGDFDDLLNMPVLIAEETTNSGDEDGNSYTWTFYHIATLKGHVTLKWYGTSNGYYSESVFFDKITKPHG